MLSESREHEERLALGSGAVGNSFPFFFFFTFIFLVSLISLQSVKVVPFSWGEKPVSIPKSLHLSQKVKKSGLSPCESPLCHLPGPPGLDPTEAALRGPCCWPRRRLPRSPSGSGLGALPSHRGSLPHSLSAHRLGANAVFKESPKFTKRSILCQRQEGGGLYS